MSEFASNSKIRGIIRGSYPERDSLDMTSLKAPAFPVEVLPCRDPRAGLKTRLGQSGL
jgi:hypothetical protein